MELKLDNMICKRKTKEIYKTENKVVKLFVENYSKANILNEALNNARVHQLRFW